MMGAQHKSVRMWHLIDNSHCRGEVFRLTDIWNSKQDPALPQHCEDLVTPVRNTPPLLPNSAVPLLTVKGEEATTKHPNH